MRISITYPTKPRRPSVHTSLVADHFGLPNDPDPHVVADDLELPIAPGSIVAFTGPSGSGKSSLLRAVAANLERDGDLVIRPDDLPLPDVAVIDALGLGFDRAAAILSSCGLAEPRLMLRRPSELSDGERWRFRLAAALAKWPAWVAADEFTAPLDRTLAKVIAFNVRRQCDRTGIGFLVATCHEDLLDDLRPDLHVRCDHDGRIEVATRERQTGNRSPIPPPDADHPLSASSPPFPAPCSPFAFKSWSASPASSKSRPERHRTGRTSLGGITGRTASDRCDS